MSQYPRIAIIGDTGGGKTLTMVGMAKKYYDAGMTVFSNFTLIGIPYQHIEFKDIVEYPEYLHDAVILIDEAHIGTDAYAFFSKDVKAITKFATQTRKRRLIFIYSTQVLTQVAKRLRSITTYIVYAQELKGLKGVISLDFHNRNPDNSYIKSRIFDGRPYFGMYDTDEIIEID